MNKLLFPTLFLFLVSCSQKKQEGKEKAPQEQATQESSQPNYFQSEQYPLRIDYLSGIKMNVDVSREKRGEPFLNEFIAYSNDSYRIEIDIAEEFIEEVDPGDTSSVVLITFYPTLKDFKDFLSERPTVMQEEITTLGNIPAGRMQRPGYPHDYFLLIPGTYAMLGVMGENVRKYNPSEISQAYSDRVADITQQMLSRIHWLKSIDSNSQEFKTWKQHILDLIKEANKAENK